MNTEVSIQAIRLYWREEGIYLEINIRLNLKKAQKNQITTVNGNELMINYNIYLEIFYEILNKYLEEMVSREE